MVDFVIQRSCRKCYNVSTLSTLDNKAIDFDHCKKIYICFDTDSIWLKL